jgi:hypothetical protein
MAELLPFAERWGPWILILVYTTYKFVPVLAERLIPDWLAGMRETRNKERESLASVYERFIAQNSETIRFIASATEALHSFQRALDANTQQMYHLTQSVERGPRCPLPDCPFMNKEAP